MVQGPSLCLSNGVEDVYWMLSIVLHKEQECSAQIPLPSAYSGGCWSLISSPVEGCMWKTQGGRNGGTVLLVKFRKGKAVHNKGESS